MSGMYCTTCHCIIRKTVPGDMVTTRLGRSQYRAFYIHGCDHGQDGHIDHAPQPRVRPLSRRVYRAEARKASEQFNEDWDAAWAVHVSGVDER